jgi:hypothetical protein
MLLLWWCSLRIQKEKLAGLQFTSMDYLSIVSTSLRICLTIPLNLPFPATSGHSLDLSFPACSGHSLDLSFLGNSGHSFDLSFPATSGHTFELPFPAISSHSFDLPFPASSGHSLDHPFQLVQIILCIFLFQLG